jgi:hypothetical protein
MWFYQSLVDSVVFGAKLDKKNHNLIPATAIRKGLEPLDVRTDRRIRLNWWLKKKSVILGQRGVGLNRRL